MNQNHRVFSDAEGVWELALSKAQTKLLKLDDLPVGYERRLSQGNEWPLASLLTARNVRGVVVLNSTNCRKAEWLETFKNYDFKGVLENAKLV